MTMIRGTEEEGFSIRRGPLLLPSSDEYIRWSQVPRNLRGKVTSLTALKKKFPSKRNFSEVRVLEEGENYRVYGRTYKFGDFEQPVHLAYECGQCSTLVFGPPRIADDTSFDDGRGMLSGRRGYDVSCGKCHAHFKSRTLAAR